jgi:hypothetical protein
MIPTRISAPTTLKECLIVNYPRPKPVTGEKRREPRYWRGLLTLKKKKGHGPTTTSCCFRIPFAYPSTKTVFSLPIAFAADGESAFDVGVRG